MLVKYLNWITNKMTGDDMEYGFDLGFAILFGFVLVPICVAAAAWVTVALWIATHPVWAALPWLIVVLLVRAHRVVNSQLDLAK